MHKQLKANKQAIAIVKRREKPSKIDFLNRFCKSPGNVEKYLQLNVTGIVDTTSGIVVSCDSYGRSAGLYDFSSM